MLRFGFAKNITKIQQRSKETQKPQSGSKSSTVVKAFEPTESEGLSSLRSDIGVACTHLFKCLGFAPLHFSLLSLWKVNFSRSNNEKCPIKGHLNN